jgi:hypothetical protein
MRARVLGAAFLTLPVAPAPAQHHMHIVATADSAALRFAAAARAGTARYRERSVAIADGYRQVGPDLPSMGEHWLNIGLVLADSIDAARPPILIYVASPDGPVLAGAAYTRMLSAGDPYPEFPRGLHAWHEHSGFIEDEALPLSHVRHGSAPGDSGHTRLGILHLWMWQDNPAGEWVADNWALPFIRAGVRAPQAADPAAGRALALAPDSGAYYGGVMTTIGRFDAREAARLSAVLAAAAADVRAIPLTADSEPSAADLERLRGIWMGVWTALGRELAPRSIEKLEEIRRLWW